MQLLMQQIMRRGKVLQLFLSLKVRKGLCLRRSQTAIRGIFQDFMGTEAVQSVIYHNKQRTGRKL